MRLPWVSLKLGFNKGTLVRYKIQPKFPGNMSNLRPIAAYHRGVISNLFGISSVATNMGTWWLWGWRRLSQIAWLALQRYDQPCCSGFPHLTHFWMVDKRRAGKPRDLENAPCLTNEVMNFAPDTTQDIHYVQITCDIWVLPFSHPQHCDQCHPVSMRVIVLDF